MLDKKGFDLWADGYDKSVGLADESDLYPFAGYKKVLNAVYNRVLDGPGRNVLDIGFGTGMLTARLYEQGCKIWGQDFSHRMIELAQEKMPEARLYPGDFSKGLAPALQMQTYDFILATYSLHHLLDKEKITFLHGLIPHLNSGGKILIGDVAFETRNELEACRQDCGEEWDEDEFYFVYEELKSHFPALTFSRYSFCAGVLELQK